MSIQGPSYAALPKSTITMNEWAKKDKFNQPNYNPFTMLNDAAGDLLVNAVKDKLVLEETIDEKAKNDEKVKLAENSFGITGTADIPVVKDF